MIATGIPIPTASRVASRRLRSRSSWLTADGPTPRPTGVPVCPGSIGTSLLGFGDFGADAVEKRTMRFQSGPQGEYGVADLVRFEQQVLALVGRCAIHRRPELGLGAGGIAGCEPRHRHAASLAPVLLRIAASTVFVGAQRLFIPSGEKERVSEVVVGEHKRRRRRDRAPQGGF